MTQEGQPLRGGRLVVAAPAGSRLEELLATYESAKAAAADAESRYKAVTDAIKAELSSANPGVAEMTLAGQPGLPRLSMTWVRPWRLDTKRFKEDHPHLYVQYATQSGHWDLRAL